MSDVTATEETRPVAAPASDHASGNDLPEPGRRGRLDIAERVVERVAVIAAAEVEGVRRVGSGLEGIVGRQYPKATAQVAGGRARVRLDIAVAWPVPLGRTAGAVRDHVGARLESLVGLTVDAVDVTVASVVPDAPREQRRVQ
ncbi:MAG: Asp23/Gls24 family envelope stress response protein [Dermatophilaceae bacterium]|nr:Asp23/Gls24 family envelope stress response protein [Dermatophilaceae bacterium]